MQSKYSVSEASVVRREERKLCWDPEAWQGGLEDKSSRRNQVIQKSFIVSEEMKIYTFTRKAPSGLVWM